MLSLLLQRAPMVRALISAEATTGNPISALLRSVVTVAAVGGYHALAGATQLTANPATPATATVGSVFAMVFSVTGAPANAASYEVRGVLPPGLSIPGLSGDLLNAQNGTISGTPTTAGSFSLSIRAWNNRNKQGNGGNPTFTLQINVQPAAVAAPPTFAVQPGSVQSAAGANVSFSASATGDGTISYQWSKDGAAIPGATASTLTLTGVTAASAGSYRVTATNAAGSTQSNVATLTVTLPPVAPSFTLSPTSQTVTPGADVTFSALATGSGFVSYQWTRNGQPIPGATSPTLTLTAVTVAAAGTYLVVATNAVGSNQSTPAILTVNLASAPVIVTQPLSQSVITGAKLTLFVDVIGSAPFTYQWRKAGVAIAGATGSALPIESVKAGDAGEYQISVTNALGTTVSSLTTLEVLASVASAVTNVSVRTNLAANQRLIVGITMAGGPKRVLLRAVGPGLGVFNVPGTMPDPRMALFRDSTSLESNDDWGGSPALANTFAAVGAFGLPTESRDAALLSTVEGGRTAQIEGAVGGTVLVEAYDAESGVTPRLTNVSARNQVGTGGDVLIAGFSISGSAPKTVLIRAIGPTLGVFGVQGVLADPKLEVFSGPTKLTENDTWSPSLAAVFSQVGAFQLADGSKDAAIVLSLSPGGYTVQVSGADGGTGEGLIEIYEVQP